MGDVEKFESGLDQWELQMQQSLTENNQSIHVFDSDINQALHEMSVSLNTKYKLTQEYENKVIERMDVLHETIKAPNKDSQQQRQI